MAVSNFGEGLNSSFNKAKFGLSSYNISNGRGWLEVDAAESITPSLVPGINLYLILELKENVAAETDIVLGKFVSATLAEAVSAAINGHGGTFYEAAFNEDINPVNKGLGNNYTAGFNNARFNLTPFNINRFKSDILFDVVKMLSGESKSEVISADISGFAMTYIEEVLASEVISGTPIIAIEFLVGENGAETVTADSFDVIRFLSDERLSETVSATVKGVAIFYWDVSGTETVGNAGIKAIMMLAGASSSETVSQDTIIGQKIKLTPKFSEIVSQESVIGQDTKLEREGLEIVSQVSILGQSVSLDREGLELVSALADIEDREEKVCILNVTLKPGEKLYINADTYSVYLDTENVIWAQEGDWIDELDRDTIKLEILAASGVSVLSAKVIYIERYL